MHRNGYIGRKLRHPGLQEKSAIIIVAFGSTSRGKAALSLFAEKVQQHYQEFTIYWAFSSAIIRKKKQAVRASSRPWPKQKRMALEKWWYSHCMFFPALNISSWRRPVNISLVSEFFAVRP